MEIRDRYPAIAAACLAIALDNGGINRGRSVHQQRRAFERWLSRQPDGVLEPIELWLSSLSDRDQQLAAIGGQDEPETIAVRQGAPPFTDDLLDAYFDEVC